MNRKYIVLSLMASFFLSTVKCQSNDECKYLSVLVYLRTNKAINDKLKQSFPALTNKKDKYVEFSLFDEVRFFGISDFKNDSILYSLGIDSSLINQDKLYFDKYFFKPFNSVFLNKVMEQPELDKSKFYLSFSKPINNYLITELEIVDPRIHPDMGRAMQMLFTFDSSGLIQNCRYAWIAYR